MRAPSHSSIRTTAQRYGWRRPCRRSCRVFLPRWMARMSDPSPRHFRLLVFDWDGTLADSAVIIVNAIQGACRDMGQPEPSDNEARYVIGLGMRDAIHRVAPQLPESDYAKFSACYRTHYLSGDGEIPLFPGAAELLDDLAARGHLLAVATGKSRVG